MKFNIGDTVVYPAQGVARVKDVVEKRIGGMKDEYFLLEIDSNQSTVMIPVTNIEEVGLRRLSNKSSVKDLYKLLQDKTKPQGDWKKRHQQNLDNMRTGELMDMGQVLRDLHALSEKKTLGVRDKKMFDQALRFVVSEVSAIEGISTEEAESRIESLLEAEEEEEAEEGKE